MFGPVVVSAPPVSSYRVKTARVLVAAFHRISANSSRSKSRSTSARKWRIRSPVSSTFCGDQPTGHENRKTDKQARSACSLFGVLIDIKHPIFHPAVPNQVCNYAPTRSRVPNDYVERSSIFKTQPVVDGANVFAQHETTRSSTRSGPVF